MGERPVNIVLVPWLPGPKGVVAQTWGHTVFWLAKYPLDRVILAHELRHVRQWDEYGLSFLFRYLAAWAAAGFNYEGNKFEAQARAAQVNEFYLVWADSVLDSRSRRAK